ncbi:MAG TPA: hypothetical protein VGR73_06445 [Bryobacteraceae bacterium]|nr:hypothetical protein [Bryobacteraceae bacterium]
MSVRFAKVIAAVALLPWAARAATFGTVVQVHGAVSDIALDETRGHLYAANFAAYRVEVMDTASRTLISSIPVSAPPSAVAVSPDGHYLVIGRYQTPNSTILGGFFPNTGGLSIVDLNTGVIVRNIELPSPVLSVTFGGDGKALVISRVFATLPPNAECVTGTPLSGSNIVLLDPASGALQPIAACIALSRLLPQNPSAGEADVLLSVAPMEIIQTAAAVSGDGKTIIILGAAVPDDSASSKNSVFLQYDVPSQSIGGGAGTSAPAMGPRSIASDMTGANVLEGWGLDSSTCLQVPANPCGLAQFPRPDGRFQIGSHAWDTTRNLIYSQVPAPGDGPVLHILDTDNLTVRERLQIQENLAGKSLMSHDMNTMYSASVSGVTIFPIGQLPQTPQVGTVQEDLLFADTGNGCTASLFAQTLNVISLGTAAADFTLALPPGTAGVTLSRTTGTTPAQVLVTIDPAAFQNAKGTTAITLTITSTAAVNLPPTVRLLVNMHDSSQVGRIVNVPGKLVDMLADPFRGRLYLLRQDKNLVQVYDMKTLTKLADMRTGNTPTHMAMTLDANFLIVGNDNSQIANVLDLNKLAPTAPIVFFGHYPRAIGVSYSDIFALVRNAGVPTSAPCKVETPAAMLDRVDFTNRFGYTPCTLDGAPNAAISSNNLPSFDGVMAASADGRFLTLALADSTVGEYDAAANTWVAGRKDFATLGGSYGAINDNLWLAGPNLLDAALVPVGTPFPATDGTPSGVVADLGIGLRTSATASNAPGVLQFINTLDLSEFDSALMVEAPVTHDSMAYPPVGQIGESILSFTRSLAVSPDQSTIFALTVSGLTVIPGNFYVPVGKPSIAAVVSTADNTSPASSGGLVSIWGTNLSGTSQMSGFPLATSLGNTCVTANGEAFPLYFSSPSLINAQIPYDIVGNAPIVVRGPAGVSAPFPVQVQPFSPAVFQNTQAIPGASVPFIVREANGLLATPSNPVHRGDTLKIYVAGMGQTTPPATAGVAAPTTPPEEVLVPPTVTVGGDGTVLLDASLTPGVAGVYQVRVTVSHSAPLGLSVPLTVTQGGVSQTSQVRVVQ